MHPEDPTHLGPYRVVRRLAETPTGWTLLGEGSGGRAVVLTILHPGIVARPGFRQRFAREARAAAAAPPWFVATVVDVEAEADPPFLVTAHVPGYTLRQFVEERGPLNATGTAALAERLVGGLATLHAAGLVHGDLTPDAVVLADDGPRLMGFGLARAAGPGHTTPGFAAPEQSAEAPATANGAPTAPLPAAPAEPSATEGTLPTAPLPATPAGSPAADAGVPTAPTTAPMPTAPMPAAPMPEPSVEPAAAAGAPPPAPLPGAPLDPAVDLFALGCVLGFAATGRSPFAAGSPQETLRRVAEADPDLGVMAEPVRSVALACLRKAPAERPAAARLARGLAGAADAFAADPGGPRAPAASPNALLPDAEPTATFSPGAPTAAVGPGGAPLASSPGAEPNGHVLPGGGGAAAQDRAAGRGADRHVLPGGGRGPRAGPGTTGRRAGGGARGSGTVGRVDGRVRPAGSGPRGPGARGARADRVPGRWAAVGRRRARWTPADPGGPAATRHSRTGVAPRRTRPAPSGSEGARRRSGRVALVVVRGIAAAVLLTARVGGPRRPRAWPRRSVGAAVRGPRPRSARSTRAPARRSSTRRSSAPTARASPRPAATSRAS